MYFGDGILRHPTQLYEALLEGVLLFLILWPPTTFSDNSKSLGSKFRKVVRDKPGTLFTLYIVGYGVIRFFIEFLREPEGGLVL